jgi:hypothetical protein
MNDMPELAQPLAPAPARGIRTASAESDQSRALAEVQAQMILAKKFPRDEKKAAERILIACQRRGLAEVSQYAFSRGGTEITGPSIDLLVVAASIWGNINHGWRELSRENGASEVECYAWDVENNTKVSRTVNIKHIRDKKDGGKPLLDERDINYHIAANASKNVRTCLERIIPPDVIDDAVIQCNATLNSNAQVTPERLKNMVSDFSEFDVTKEMIEARIQRRLDSMTPPQLVNISRIYKSLKDGMSQPGDWFDMSLSAKKVVEPKKGETAETGQQATAEADKTKKAEDNATKPKEKATKEKPVEAKDNPQQQAVTEARAEATKTTGRKSVDW